jgi:hypothetical protein
MATKQSLNRNASQSNTQSTSTSGRLANLTHQPRSPSQYAQSQSSRKDSFDGEFGTTKRKIGAQPNHLTSVRPFQSKHANSLRPETNRLSDAPAATTAAHRSTVSASTSGAPISSAIASRLSAFQAASAVSPVSQASDLNTSRKGGLSTSGRSTQPTGHQLAGVLAKHKMVANQLMNGNTDSQPTASRPRQFVKAATFGSGPSGSSTSAVSTATTGSDLNQLRNDNFELMTHSSVVGRKLDNLRSRSLPEPTERPSSGPADEDMPSTSGRAVSRLADESDSSSDELLAAQLNPACLTEQQARQLYLKHPYLIEATARPEVAAHSTTTPTSLSEYNRRLMKKDPIERHERKSTGSTDSSHHHHHDYKSEIPQEVAQLLQRSARARLDLSNQQSAAGKRSGGYTTSGFTATASPAMSRLTNAYRSDSLDSPLNAIRVPPYRRSFTPGAVTGVERSTAWVPMPLTRSSTLERINHNVSSGLSAASAIHGGSGSIGPLSDSHFNTNSSTLSASKPRSDYANRKLALLNKSRSSHSIAKSD